DSWAGARAPDRRRRSPRTPAVFGRRWAPRLHRSVSRVPRRRLGARTCTVRHPSARPQLRAPAARPRTPAARAPENAARDRARAALPRRRRPPAPRPRCRRSGGRRRPRAPRSGSRVRIYRQTLVEEPADEQDGADREERERARDRAQERKVVEEDLCEADPEEREPAELEGAHAARQSHVQEREPDDAPERADRGVPALERRVEAAADRLEPLEDSE